MANEVLKFEESWYKKEVKKVYFGYLATRLYEAGEEHLCGFGLRNVIIESYLDDDKVIVTLYFSRVDYGEPEVVCTLYSNINGHRSNRWKVSDFHIDWDRPLCIGINIRHLTNLENFITKATDIINDFIARRIKHNKEDEDREWKGDLYEDV